MAISVRGIKVDVDPFVRETFPKWMVQIGAEVDVSCGYTQTTDVRTSKIAVKDRIDVYGFMSVFSDLAEDEKALLLLDPREEHSSWSKSAWGGGSRLSRFEFTKMFSTTMYDICRLTYVVSDGSHDEFGEHDMSADVTYIVDNIIRVVVDKATIHYYGLTRRFATWLADTTVSHEERRRRSRYASMMVLR